MGRQVTQRLRKRSPQAPCFPDCVQDCVCPASSSWFLPLLCQYQSQGQPPGPGSSPSSAGACPTPPHKGQGSPPSPQQGPPDLSPSSQRLLGKDMLPGQGLQQPLHFGLEFHDGLAGTRVFLWGGQKVGKGKEMVSDRLPGRRVVTAQGQNWSALGSVGPGTCKKAETCRGLETELPGVTEGAIPERLPDPSKP